MNKNQDRKLYLLMDLNDYVTTEYIYSYINIIP